MPWKVFRTTVVHCIVIIIFLFFFFFLFLKAHLWPTEVREDASDEPFSYQKYYVKHYEDHKHNIMVLTHCSKVRFMEFLRLYCCRTALLGSTYCYFLLTCGATLNLCFCIIKPSWEVQQEESRVIGCGSRCSRSLIGERRILPVLKLERLRPPEMLLETASRRNCDTARGPVVGREVPRALLRSNCSLSGCTEKGFGVYGLGSWKMHTIKKLQEIHVNSVLYTDIKFNISYVIIILKCSCRQRKPLNC